MNGCELLASCRNLEHTKTKAAFKGCGLPRPSVPAVPDPAGKKGGGDRGRGAGGCFFFFYFNLLTAALSLALSSALRTGRLEPAHLLCCPSHPVTALLGGLPRWHSGASGKTETSNAVLLLRVFLGSSWGSNVENEF